MSDDYKRYDLARHPILQRVYDAGCCVEGFPASEHQTKTATVVGSLREPAVLLLDEIDRLRARVAELEAQIKPPKRVVAVCGVDCNPGDALCNNYCNMAPQKGPMAPHPPRHPDGDEGKST